MDYGPRCRYVSPSVFISNVYFLYQCTLMRVHDTLPSERVCGKLERG